MWRTSPNTDRTLAGIIVGVLFAAVPGLAQEDKSIVVASTTSTQDSGLFDYLLPIVKQKTGIRREGIAQGTGQALDTARRGDADVVLVHAEGGGIEIPRRRFRQSEALPGDVQRFCPDRTEERSRRRSRDNGHRQRR